MSESTDGATPPQKKSRSTKAAQGSPESGGDAAPGKNDPVKSDPAKPTGLAGADAAKKKRPFVQRWVRRLYLAVPIVLIFMIGLRVALIWLLPPAINKAAAIFGLQCHYDKLDMALLGGDFGIWHVTVTPIGSDKALAAADYCRLDVSTLALLRGRIHISRLEADGADVQIDREADGSIPLLTRFGGSGGAAAPAPAAAPTAPSVATATQTFDLAPPLEVDSIRVSHVQAHLNDKSVTPAMAADLSLDFWLNDLGSSSRALQWGADVRLWPVVDVVHIEGQGTTSPSALSATITASVRGIHADQAAAYLRLLGIEPLGSTMAASMRGTFNAAVIAATPGNAPGLKGSLALSSMSLTVDGKPAASAGGLTLNVDSYSAGKLVISKVSVDACRVAAVRTNRGTLVAAGLELGGTPPTTATPKAAAAAPAAAPKAATAGTPTGPLTRIELRELDLHDLVAALHDEDTNPAADLAVGVNDFAIKNVVLSPAGGSGAITFGGSVQCPGIASGVTIDGSISPWGAQKSAAFKVDAVGVNPTALRTYLQPLGIESQLKSGEFKLGGNLTLSQGADGSYSGGARISPLVFDDGQQLLAFDSVTVDGLTTSADFMRIGMTKLAVSGPSAQVVHEASGAWRGLGFRFDPVAMLRGPASAAPAVSKDAAAAQPAPGVATAPGGAGATNAPARANGSRMTLPRIQIDQLTWGSVKLGLRDEAQTPVAEVTISDAGIDVSGLVLDVSQSGVVPAAKVHGWLSVDGIAKRLEMAGNVTGSISHPAVDMQIDGTGLNLAALAPYLHGTGIEPLVKEGELHLHAAADVVTDDAKSGGPLVTASLSKVTFADGDAQLAALDSLKVDGFSMSGPGGAISVNGFDTTGAFASAGREADGSLVVFGIRLGAPLMGGSAATQPTTAPSMAAPMVLQPAAPTTMAGISATAPVAKGPWRLLPPLPAVNIGHVNVTDAKLKWSDRADGKSIDTAVTVWVQSGGIVVGKDTPSAFKVQLKVDGAVDSMAIDGNASLGADAQSLDVEVTGSGIRAGPLAGYVPAGMKVDLTDGRLHAKFGAALAPSAAGGMSAKVFASDVDYRDGETGDALLKVGSFAATVGRIDPAAFGNIIDIQEISSDGVESMVHLAGGAVQAMGVTIGGDSGGATATATGDAATTAPTNSAPGVAAATQPAAPGDTNVAAASEANPLFDLRHSPPTVMLDKLDLKLAKFSVIDTDLGGSPVVVTQARLWSDSALTLLSPHPETLQPCRIRMTTNIDPLVKEINVDTSLSLFLPEPAVAADIAASGISGPGLERVLPKLKDQIDGSELTDGRFKTHVDASVKLSRRGAFDIDFTRTMQAQVMVKPVEFRNGDGPVLAGLDSVEVDNANVNPRTGDVLVAAVDLTKPAARVWKDKAGIHALGLIVKIPPPATAPAASPTTVPAHAAVASNPAPAAATAPSVPAGPEFRIDRLTINGLDFEYHDTSVDPPMTIPLTDLNVSAQNLTNRAMSQNTTMTFSVDVRSGKVDLPKRQAGGSLIAGAVGGLASVIGNLASGGAKPASTQEIIEQRDLFDDITADGAVSMYPQPRGTVRANISSVEMREFKGLAETQGVTVNGGLFDGRFNIALPGDGTATSQSKIILTNAQLSEPPNGLLQRVLKLPAPIDVVIGTVQDAGGAMTVPLNFKTKITGIGTDAIVDVVVQTIGQSIVTALSSAPQKAIQAVIPLPWDQITKAAKEQPIEIDFAPADTGLDPASQAKLAALQKRLRNGEALSIKVHGDLGGADVSTVVRRVNLDPAESIALAAQLRQKKVELIAERQVAAESARAELATGSAGQASATVLQLAALDRELGKTEDALDNLYDLLRPGAEQIVARRVRQACLALAQSRLDTVTQALISAAGTKTQSTISPDPAQVAQTVGDGGGRVTIVIGPAE